VSFVSRVSPGFWKLFNELPPDLKRRTEKAYRLFLDDPFHPSLMLKKIGVFWSARISLDCRALAYREGNEFFWFWIGPHGAYEEILKRAQ
jgi:hypothetical protein